MNTSKNDAPPRRHGFDFRSLVTWLDTALLALSTLVALVTVWAIGGWTTSLGRVVIGTPTTVHLAQPKAFDPLPGGLHATVHDVRVLLDPDFLDYLLRAAAVIPGAAVFIYVMLVARALVATVPTGQPFTAANTTRVRHIGLALAIGWPLSLIANLVFTRVQVNRAGLGGATIDQLDLLDLTWPVIAGTVLLVLAAVISAGERMRRDVDGLV